jgi:hypothetical protein
VVPRGDPCNDDGEWESLRRELPMPERADARDFRRPWEDEVGLGEEDRLFGVDEGGEGEGVHAFPARSASSCER